jgi:hypothetical protein
VVHLNFVCFFMLGKLNEKKGHFNFNLYFFFFFNRKKNLNALLNSDDSPKSE